MSDRIVESLNEMKQIYLESVSGLVISERDEYLQYIEEKNKKMKDNNDEDEEDNDDGDEEDNDDGDEADADYDGDGEVESGEDEFLGSRHNAIRRAMGRTPDGDPPKKKKKKMDESFVDWRSELYEKVGDVEADIEDSKRQIKERSNIKNTVEINPNINIGESVELSEEYIEDVIDIAAEYFYEQGLNEEGLKILIDKIGEESLLEWVFDIANENFLNERRLRPGETALPARTRERITGKSVSRKKVSDLKGGSAAAKVRSDDARRKARETARQTPEPTERQRVLARLQSAQRERNIEKAKKSQETTTQSSENGGSSQTPQSTGKKGVEDILARVVLSGYRGHKAAMRERGKGSTLGKQLSRGLKTAAAAFVKKGTEHLREDFVDWIYDVLNEGIDISDWSISELYGQYLTITEKAESEQQQKLFGLALSVKRGETPRSEVSKQVLEIVDSMSETEIRKFAKTKHKGLPKKKEG